MATIAIIGAGLAGLAAGRTLADAGRMVTLFEKSRGVGGRAATRRVEGVSFDHGAQYFKAEDAESAALVAASPEPFDIGRPVWVFDAAGRIAAGDPALNADPKWTWPSGLTALPKLLARGLELRTETTVAALRRTTNDERATWELLDADGRVLGMADAVLLTAPAPQSAAIVRASQLDRGLRDELAAELDRASYRRCISVTLAYARRPELPWYALVNTDRQHPIAWLACEHDKPGRAPAGQGLLTAQMGHDWSVAHWEAVERGTYGLGAALPAPLEQVAGLARELAGDLGAPLWANAQRWRYALPDSSCDGERLNRTGSGIYFAGDFLTMPGRLHLALAAGRAVAATMLAEM